MDNIGVCLRREDADFTLCWSYHDLLWTARDYDLTIWETFLAFFCYKDIILYHVVVGRDENTAYHYNIFFWRELEKFFEERKWRLYDECKGSIFDE